MLDNPSITLYWCLRHGQRRQIAEQFGVWRAGDGQIGEQPVAQLWLRRLSACGSIVPALDRVRDLHQSELRRIETTIREYGAQAWRAELETWRTHKYHLLALPNIAPVEADEHAAAGTA